MSTTRRPSNRRSNPSPRPAPVQNRARAQVQPDHSPHDAPRAALLYKPFGVLTQFRAERGTPDAPSRPTLASLFPHHGYAAAGRLDRDSEGLIVLTRDGRLQARIAQPPRAGRHQQPRWGKTYWVQVEGRRGETAIDPAALEQLARGVTLNDGPTRPAIARAIPEPDLPARDPPIRFRREIPTFWIALTLFEGRNRQVRRMTAAVGYPTLRLVRAAIGPWTLEGLSPGAWRWLSEAELTAAKTSTHAPSSIPRTSV